MWNMQVPSRDVVKSRQDPQCASWDLESLSVLLDTVAAPLASHPLCKLSVNSANSIEPPITKPSNTNSVLWKKVVLEEFLATGDVTYTARGGQGRCSWLQLAITSGLTIRKLFMDKGRNHTPLFDVPFGSLEELWIQDAIGVDCVDFLKGFTLRHPNLRRLEVGEAKSGIFSYPNVRSSCNAKCQRKMLVGLSRN